MDLERQQAQHDLVIARAKVEAEAAVQQREVELKYAAGAYAAGRRGADRAEWRRDSRAIMAEALSWLQQMLGGEDSAGDAPARRRIRHRGGALQYLQDVLSGTARPAADGAQDNYGPNALLLPTQCAASRGGHPAARWMSRWG